MTSAMSLRERFRTINAPRDRYLVDSVAFDKEVLGLDVPPFHQEVDTLIQEVDNIIWNAPVGHGKSTKIGFARAVHEICKDRNVRMIVGSKSLPRACDLVRRIKAELENNERLIDLFGEFKGKEKWDATQMQVIRDKNLKEPTITATGLGGNIEGVRADLGILDDPIDIESMTSEAEREASKLWFDNTFTERLEPGAKCWVVGTRWHPEDLYDHIAKKPNWANPVHKAIVNESKKEVLWPERWSWERLMDKRAEVGTIAFELRYQNNPQVLKGVLFKSEWLEYVDDKPEGLTVYQGWDLAISEKETADYTACFTVGVDKDNNVYLLDVFRDHIDFPTQMEKVMASSMVWEPKSIAIESNAYQRAAAQHIKRTTMLPVVESKAVGDKVMRIQGMSPHFENARIKVWRGMTNLEVFVSEFVNFPYGSHDDTLDALWHALQQAIKHKKYGVAKW